MSYAHYETPIKCPECGLPTHELYHIENSLGKTLMCDACYDDTEEGLKDWDESWKGEWNDTE